MNNRQRVFIAEYLKDFNASRAARAAGYSERTARKIGSENLTKPDIKAEIDRLIAERTMGKEEILLRLTDISRGDMADLMDITPTGHTVELMKRDEQGNLVVKPETKLIRKIKTKVTTIISKRADADDKEIVETELELYSALDGLQTLAKINGLVIDKAEISGPEGGAIPLEMFEKALKKAYGE